MSTASPTAFKPMMARGRRLGEGETPAVCMPLVGSARTSLLAEIRALLPQQPDVFEWRADHFEDLAALETVTETALALRRAVGDVPLIFTLRSAREGGMPQALDERRALALIQKMACSTLFDFIDLELATDEQSLRPVVRAAQEAGTQVILSSHDFLATPPNAALHERLRHAQSLGADVAKIAVMPVDSSDVLRLMEVTCEARHALDLPLVTMAMGPLGVASRAVGHLFGSSMTFATGLVASAPGQLSIEDLRKIFGILRSRTLPR